MIYRLVVIAVVVNDVNVAVYQVKLLLTQLVPRSTLKSTSSVFMERRFRPLFISFIFNYPLLPPCYTVAIVVVVAVNIIVAFSFLFLLLLR